MQPKRLNLEANFNWKKKTKSNPNSQIEGQIIKVAVICVVHQQTTRGLVPTVALEVQITSTITQCKNNLKIASTIKKDLSFRATVLSTRKIFSIYFKLK